MFAVRTVSVSVEPWLDALVMETVVAGQPFNSQMGSQREKLHTNGTLL